MHSDAARITRCFRDVLQATTLILQWVGEAGEADRAVADVKVRSAIERQLLIVSEAAIRLDKLDPEAAPRLAPGIDWPGIRGIGNFIRHRYDDLDTSIIVSVLRERLDPLRMACSDAIQTLEGS